MKDAALLALTVLWLTLATPAVRCEEEKERTEKPANVQIKIVDSPASRIAPIQSLNGKELTLRIKPANISGPAHLQLLAGHCFKLTEKEYEYSVCPFYNVTQKEVRVGWNSFHGVLGVWREWLIENDTFVGMHYVMGQECSVGDREVKVMFNCSTMTRIHSTSEPSTCHYIIWMDTPLACFKGAMQVYHVLNPDQLKEWEQYDYEYHADEITFQGLTKRRRKLLIKTGLLFDSEKEKARLAEEKKKKREEELRAKEQREKELLVNPFPQSPLTSCEQERDKLKKELDELKAKIQGVIKDYPAVAYRLGFLQNFTHTEDHVTGHVTDHVTESHEVERDLRKEVVVNNDRPVEPVAAVLEGKEEREGERGGVEGGVADLDEPAGADKDQLGGILEEINKRAEKRDEMELERELSELHKPEHGVEPQGRGEKEAIATQQETDRHKDMQEHNAQL